MFLPTNATAEEVPVEAKEEEIQRRKSKVGVTRYEWMTS